MPKYAVIRIAKSSALVIRDTCCIKMVSSLCSSQCLSSDVWNNFNKVEALLVQCVGINLHIMAVLQTRMTIYKGIMMPCMFQNLLVLQDKRQNQISMKGTKV